MTKSPEDEKRGRMQQTKSRTAVGASVLVLVLSACSQAPAVKPAALDPALEAKVLDSVPSDIENRTFIDFEGKVQLIGYDLAPRDLAAPGSKIKLKLYWKSSAPLAPGWNLFTHVLDSRGKQVKNADEAGPLRKLALGPGGRQQQVLGPSAWKPGKIYIDELEFDLPREVQTPEVSLMVGLWLDPKPGQKGGSTYRLGVISGPSDGENRGIVAHLKTGVVAPARSANPKT
jgi:hypothetical protein